ncbi:mitochondrial peripheral inner membrane protein [Sporothrix eucalyptigena]
MAEALIFKKTSPPPLNPPKKNGRIVLLLTTLLLAGATVYWVTAGGSSGAFDENGQRRHAAGGAGLNTTTFVPFEIVAREDVSPTAFVLTLRLPVGGEVSKAARTATSEAVAAAWRHGLWSVEVKQPQLQIARDYTPLPAADAADGQSSEELRLFVRAVPGGEVSKYLSRRPLGSTIDLRGPRLSFDVTARLGEGREMDEGKQVVVLAGGTGVATALQAADAVLRTSPSASVSILWANRQPYDTIGLDTTSTSALNPIVRDIRALQTRYGTDRMRVHSFVDAEQTMITEGAVRRAIEGSDGDSTGGRAAWYWPWSRASPKLSTVSSARQGPPADPSCVYHSARVLERLEADAARGSAKAKACSCSSKEATGATSDDRQGVGHGGKNLVLVSGPDGFISAWAGAKTWMGGQERQGPVGGILGHMAARDPQTFSNWQVLKL